MIGDLMLWCRTASKQLFCLHDYEEGLMHAVGREYTSLECRKCGRSKVK